MAGSTAGYKFVQKHSASAEGYRTFHLETESSLVKITNSDETLDTVLGRLDGNRTFTLTGDVTGSVTHDGHSNVTINATVGDDSHEHTGSTVLVQTVDSETGERTAARNRAVVSDANGRLAASVVTVTELAYLSGVTGSIQTQLNNRILASQIGVAGGIVPLGNDLKINSVYLPSYVDDVIEGTINAAHTEFTKTGDEEPLVPESGKLYGVVSGVDINKVFRWAGDALGYVQMNEGVVLGETEDTAYRGDRGKIAYDHSQAAHARTDATLTEASNSNGYVKINGAEVKVYEHPAGNGNLHLPAGGSAGKYVGWQANGTGKWDDLAVGSTENMAIYTGANGVLTAGSFTTADPTASGTGTDFIATISQDSKGKITATKKSLPAATALVAGIVKVGAQDGAAAYVHTHNYAGSSTPGGAATSAAKLTTAVKARVNLSSTSEVDFDGSAALNPGVTGTLAVANGGTGATTAAAARLNIGAHNVAFGGTTAPSGQNTGDFWFEDISST